MVNRFHHIDATRGLLLVVMSVDHARSFLHRSHPTEIWGMPLPNYHGNTFDSMMRWITHICAPGFFFLLGVSMVLYARSHPRAALLRHFWVRGSLLVLMQLFVENIAWLLGLVSAKIAPNHYGYVSGPGHPALTFVYV
jgi:uncharacterized membrane protein